MDSITRLLGVVLWPAVVVLAMFVFRGPVTRLINQIEELSFGGAKAKFRKETDAVLAATVSFVPPVATAPAATVKTEPVDAKAPKPRTFEGAAEHDQAPAAADATPSPAAGAPDSDDTEWAAEWFVPPLPISEYRPTQADDATWGPIERLAYLEPAAAITRAFITVDDTLAKLGRSGTGLPFTQAFVKTVNRLELEGQLPVDLAAVLRRLADLRAKTVHDPRTVDINSAVTFVAAAKNVDRTLARLVNENAAKRLGDRVRERREELKLGQAELAQRAGTTASVIESVEHGHLSNVRAEISPLRLDSALGWASGSSETLLVEGREPFLLRDPPPDGGPGGSG